MAIQTRVITRYDDGKVRFEIDYDDGTLQIVAVRCDNGSTFAAFGEVIQELEPDAQSKHGRTYSHRFEAGTLTEFAVPTTPNGKLQYTIDPASGRIDGVTFRSRWPD